MTMTTYLKDISKLCNIINRFTINEYQLNHTVKSLQSKDIIPIIDYAVESISSKSDINSFISKHKKNVQLYPNQFHALKLSALGVNSDEVHIYK